MRLTSLDENMAQGQDGRQGGNHMSLVMKEDNSKAMMIDPQGGN